MGLKDKDYRIVYGPDEADSNIETPYELQNELEELYIKAKKGKASVKGRLDKLIKRYPKLPFLRNYLVTWYRVNKQHEAAYMVNEEILRLSPDYIFALVYKAGVLLAKKDIDAVEKLLNGRLDIESFYPGRKAFHLSEFRAAISMAFEYLLATGRPEQAEEQIKLLEEAEIDGEISGALQMKLTRYKLAKGLERRQMLEKMEIHGEEREACTLPQKEVTMTATSPLFDFLYGEQWKIDEGQLQDCISNHKEALITEIYHIITTAIEGYEYIEKQSDITGDYPSAVLHGLLVLPYLEDDKSFSHVLELLRQPQSCCEFWELDWKSDLLEHYFYHFTEKKLEQIVAFISEPYCNTSSKNTLLELLPRFTLLNPESRDKVIDALIIIFDHFTVNRNNTALFDSTVLAFAVGAAIDLKAFELLHIIIPLYEKGWASLSVSGDIDEVQKWMLSKENTLRGTFFEDVFSHLNDIKKACERNDEIDMFDRWKMNLSSPEDEEDDESDDDYRPAQNMFIGASKNAPCPCGSGKKYKRCHGLE